MHQIIKFFSRAHMDSLFRQFDALDQEAASCLLTLGELEQDGKDTIETQVLSRTPSDLSNSAGSIPQLKPTVVCANTSPIREFKLAGMKRERGDTYTIFYCSGYKQIGVPYTKGDGADKLIERQNEAARRLFEASRGDAYCSWRSTMISLAVQDARWTKFRSSRQQQRYYFKSIQLVITRYTCTQWRGTNDPCRNCENRKWRTACLKPSVLMHIMPLPDYRQETELCEQCLLELEPADIAAHKSDWTQRMPQLNAREATHAVM